MTRWQIPRAGRRSDGLWAPARRGLTIGLLLSTTFIAAEALAAITIMPRVARQLGGIALTRRLPLHELDASAAGEAVAGAA
jgi:hypothetical protein